MIKIIENVYSKEECEQLANIGKANANIEPEDHKGKNKNLTTYTAPINVYGNLLERFFVSAEITNLEHFGFDVFEFQYSHVNYNRYEIGHEYFWHIDSNINKGLASDIKFTGIINVSTQPYEGGEFEIFLADEINKKLATEFTTGSVLFFLSLLSHKVKPVTKGVRESLSYWFNGPKWK